MLRRCRDERVIVYRKEADRSEGQEALRAIVSDIPRETLIVPIGRSEHHEGVILLIARHGQAFQKRHYRLAALLSEPFSAALANDHRLREMAMLRQAAQADNRSLLRRLGRDRLEDTIIGAAEGLKAVMQRVELVAQSDVPVLFFGETGTGKELLARRSISVRPGRPVRSCGSTAAPSRRS